jgi:hypothetical protein
MFFDLKEPDPQIGGSLGMVYHLGFYLLCVVHVMTSIVVGVGGVAHDNCQMVTNSCIIKSKLIMFKIT